MPAPAVIPAPIAYIKVVAVKKLVVGFRVIKTLPIYLSLLKDFGRFWFCFDSFLLFNSVTGSALNWVDSH